MAALVAVETVVLVLLAVLVVGLLRSHAEILRRLHELGAGLDDGPGAAPVAVAPPSPRRSGEQAPDVVGVTPGDEVVAVSPAGASRDTLLAFLSTGCPSCASFWDALSQGVDVPGGARVLVVTRGPGDDSVGAVRKLAPAGVDVVMSSEAWQAYGVPGAPYFVHVDGRSGVVAGEGTARTWDQVGTLLGRALDDAGAQAASAASAASAMAGPWSNDAEREARIDHELQAAGIFPGDPRLHHGPEGHA